MILTTTFIVLAFLHGLVSGPLEQSVVTAPILFTTAGMLALVALPELEGAEGGGDSPVQRPAQPETIKRENTCNPLP